MGLEITSPSAPLLFSLQSGDLAPEQGGEEAGLGVFAGPW